MTEVFAICECFCNYPFLDDGGRGTADDSPGFVLRLSVQYKFGSGPNLDLGVNIQPKFHFVDQQTNDRVRYHRGISEHLSYLTGQPTMCLARVSAAGWLLPPLGYSFQKI